MIFVYQIMRMIAIVLDQQRAALQRIADVQMRKLAYSDQPLNLDCSRAFVASNSRSVHHLVHAVVIAIAHHWTVQTSAWNPNE